MEKYHMLEECGTLVLGVSGGADSVCMLLLLEKICKERGIAPVAVHIEHGLRGEESLADAAFVENLCKEKDIPFLLYSYDVAGIAAETGESVEEAGRRLRYAAFSEAAERYGRAKIAVAHNENDNAETVLFHLARGSGLTGVGGIPPVRGNIIRPLLGVSREEIEAYLKEEGQPYRTDRTNFSDDYARNRIRHEVLPALCGVNAGAVSHIGRTAAELTEAAAYIGAETARAAERCVRREPDGSGLLVMEREFFMYPAFLRGQILYRAVTEAAGGAKDITREHVDMVRGLFEKQTGKCVSLPHGCGAKRVYEGVFIAGRARAEGKGAGADAAKCGEKGQKREFSGDFSEEFSFRILENKPKIGEIPKNKCTKWFDYDKIKDGLRIRTRQEGDFFVLDKSGKRKKLKSYFIDEKIRSGERDDIPLLAEGSHILWIVGYRISAYYKVTDQTKRILEVQYHEREALRNGGSHE